MQVLSLALFIGIAVAVSAYAVSNSFKTKTGIV
jgi:hypothetical protein